MKTPDQQHRHHHGDPQSISPRRGKRAANNKLVYLAARYERREELLTYRASLVRAGFTIISSWLLVDRSDWAEAARIDLEELHQADILIFFSEDLRSAWPRGSRCVEYGVALESGKQIIVIGNRENAFHWLLPDEAFFESIQAFITSQGDR